MEHKGKISNAWLIHLDDERVERLSHGVVVTERLTRSHGILEGDLIFLHEERERCGAVVTVGRVYRIRTNLNAVTFLFDAEKVLETPVVLEEFGLEPNTESWVTRIEWTKAIEFLSHVGIDLPERLPLIEDQAYVRDLLQMAVIDDLLGPADGPFEEVVGVSVRDRYLVGKLAPPETRVSDDQVEDLPDLVTTDPDGADREFDASTSRSLVPSSIGLTFCVDGEVDTIEVEGRWGRYERGESEKFFDEETGRPKRAWKRVPCGGRTVIRLSEGTVGPVALYPDRPGVVVQGIVRPPLPNGDRLVTLFLVNLQDVPETNQDEAWVFQPELVVRSEDGSAVFRRRPIADGDRDPERKSLSMIYRRHVEFAVGHGVSVHAEVHSEDPERAVEVRTRVVPEYEVPVTEAPGLDDNDRPAMRRMIEEGLLDMSRLADMERHELIEALRVLTDDYRTWIEEQQVRIGKDLVGHDDAARSAIRRCSEILSRLEEGIEVLETDDKALKAFRFANRAMALQRVHSIYARERRRRNDITLEDVDIPGNRTWRPFQLAFLLLALPSLADPMHRDRTVPLEAYADLLWFPTGGGKTEAYLGLAAFAMAVRRLQGKLGGYDGTRGLTVIMRYTLRLLTLQQFRRASTLICAMEHLRKKAINEGDLSWGMEPFTIGLWVGQSVTPNTTEESNDIIISERNSGGRQRRTGRLSQITSCPWCGSEISPRRDIEVSPFSGGEGRTIIYCSDLKGRCEFSRRQAKGRGLPVMMVDDEIYRRPPSMLIATVDKFALMAWRGEIQTLFGRAEAECERHGLIWPGSEDTGTHRRYRDLPAVKRKEPVQPIRPPDLIIQDEFHLISGPLGTMVGLYETAVEALCTWKMKGKQIHPKVVASTATVRKAQEQIHNVFLRRVAIFPPHGLDAEDDFFSVQRPKEVRPGRRYLGICAIGSSRPATLIRVYVAFLTAAKALFDRFGHIADPYMTLVGYFNSLRELGGMRRLVEDDVQTRCYRVQMSDVVRPGLAQRNVSEIDELTSRVSNEEIPLKLDRLEVSYKTNWERGEIRSLDVVLATNMLSVGVDVNRLGLMVVNGQPKTTAEYIQATSRVGRNAPGLVCTVLTWARPRDLSHYETFEHYHATFYQHVEAQSVTPFAPRALDRGLTGVLVSIMRLYDFELNPNHGAEKMISSTHPSAVRAKEIIVERAWQVSDTKEIHDRTDAMIARRLDVWVHEAEMGGRRLGYDRTQDGVTVPLLRRAGKETWGEFTVPMSLREVEPGVRLVMRIDRMGQGPDWTHQRSRKDQVKMEEINE